MNTNHNQLSMKALIISSVGTLIEYYDYAIFAIFLPVIMPTFTAGESAEAALSVGFVILLVSQISRPFGGLFFGYFGDRIGRAKTLTWSMYGIATATLLIGIIPSYETIGYAAIVMLVFAKAVQLFCFGGEYNGAGIYVVEHAPNHREGFFGSLLTSMTLMGALIASLMGIVLTSSFFPSWSWRIAFVIGAIAGFISISYRKSMIETRDFNESRHLNKSFKSLLVKYPKELVAVMLIGGYVTLPYTIVLIFINPMLTVKGIITPQQLMLIQSLLIVVAILTLLASGRLADKYQPLKVMRLSALCLIGLSYPLTCLVDSGNLALILSCEVLLIIINEIMLGPSNALFKSLFPAEYRYTASSFSYCLGMGIVCGITPLIGTALINHYGGYWSLSFYLVGYGLLTFICLLFLPKANRSMHPTKAQGTQALSF